MGRLTGRIGGAFAGRDIQRDNHDGLVDGRFGGAFLGKDVRLQMTKASGGRTQLEGRYGGAVDGKDMTAELDDYHLIGRIGGGVVGNDVSLEPVPGFVTGRVGGATFGFDVNLEYDPNAGQLWGRLGGAFIGKDVRLALEGTSHRLWPPCWRARWSIRCIRKRTTETARPVHSVLVRQERTPSDEGVLCSFFLSQGRPRAPGYSAALAGVSSSAARLDVRSRTEPSLFRSILTSVWSARAFQTVPVSPLYGPSVTRTRWPDLNGAA